MLPPRSVAVLISEKSDEVAAEERAEIEAAKKLEMEKLKRIESLNSPFAGQADNSMDKADTMEE